MNNKTFDYTCFGHTYGNCRFEVGRYGNNNLAIEIVNDEEGEIATVTVNMGHELPDDRICVKTWSENRNMNNFLKIYGFVEREDVGSLDNGSIRAPVMKLTAKGKEYLGLDKMQK